MAIYIYQLPDWPRFTWQHGQIAPLLAEVRHWQGRFLGKMESLGFNLQAEASLQTLTLDVLKSSEIKGGLLDAEQVRSSIAWRLEMDNMRSNLQSNQILQDLRELGTFWDNY